MVEPMVAEAADMTSEPVTVPAVSTSDPVTVKLLPKKLGVPVTLSVQSAASA